MTRTEYLLDTLLEECAEVIKDCSKAMRFTLEEREAENKTVKERYLHVLNKESYLRNSDR